jgi:hypothetical protein
MTAIQKQNKMIQLDAFKTDVEITEDKIYNKLKENFDHRVNFLFARISELHKAYDAIVSQCAFLYDEIEAAKYVFISSNRKITEIQEKLEAQK